MKIHELSGEQLALIPQVRDKWLKIGLDTTPVDRAKVRKILGRLYALANKRTPKHIIHLESPLQISNVLAKLRLESERIRPELDDAVGVHVCQEVCGQFADQINEQVADHVNEQVRQYVTNLIGGGQARSRFPIAAAVAADLHVSDQICEATRHPSGKFAGHLRAWPFGNNFGQFDISLSWFDFVGRLGIDVSRLAPTFDLAKACGWAVLFLDWALISAKPQRIERDERGQLHCETGAAVRYPDGFSVFSFHGVRVLEKVVVAPETITVSEIEFESNAEARRVMIERYGRDRFLKDSQAEEVHRDDFGILYRKNSFFDEDLVTVKVVNSTPEPDGSFKDYFLRVPPTMERARQAVAWTFGKEENDYAPALQT